jgi:plasmid maintenance system antidote protein VapI
MAKRVKRNNHGSVNALGYLESKFGPLTFAMTIRSIRDGEEVTLDQFAKRLGISRSHLCDVEKGRKCVSPERAARWAKLLGYSAQQFVRLAIQADLDAAGLKFKVAIEAA